MSKDYRDYGLIPISDVIARERASEAVELWRTLCEGLGWIEETPDRKQAREAREKAAAEHRAKMDALYDCGEHQQNFDACGQCHGCIGDNW